MKGRPLWYTSASIAVLGVVLFLWEGITAFDFKIKYRDHVQETIRGMVKKECLK